MLVLRSYSCDMFKAAARSKNLYRQVKTLDLDLVWNVKYYRLVEAARGLTTMLPAKQHVKEMLPARHFSLWPPSSTRAQKVSSHDRGGDAGDPSLEDLHLHTSLTRQRHHNNQAICSYPRHYMSVRALSKKKRSNRCFVSCWCSHKRTQLLDRKQTKSRCPWDPARCKFKCDLLVSLRTGGRNSITAANGQAESIASGD